MKKLKRLIKGALMASAVYHVCVEACKEAKAAADATFDDAVSEAASKEPEAVTRDVEPFDVVMVGGEVCFLDGDGDVLIVDGDGVVN